MEKLRNKEVWNGEHKGIQYEIVHWYLGWNYYIILPVAQIPESRRKTFILKSRKSEFNLERTWEEYESAPIISDLDWHGGITDYEKIFGQVVLNDSIEVRVTSIKMGCDYMHLFDENRHYTLDVVKSDAEHSVDKLLELVPDMKIRCHWNGHYYNRDEGMVMPNGSFLANENKGKMKETVKKYSI